MNTKTIKTMIAMAAIAAAGAASAQQMQYQDNDIGSNAYSSVPASTLTRAEVQAALALWNRAGMSALNDSDQYGVTAESTQRMATYQRLRNGPAYQAEVQRLQGHAVATGNTGARSVN